MFYKTKGGTLQTRPGFIHRLLKEDRGRGINEVDVEPGVEICIMLENIEHREVLLTLHASLPFPFFFSTYKQDLLKQ